MDTLIFIVKNPSELQQVANEAIAWSDRANLWVFDGVPGAGKTTFIQAICKEFKVIDTVTSPTFSLLNQYKTANNETIHHIDFYRLNSEEDAKRVGLDDAIDEADFCFIEWWRMFPAMASEKRIEVDLDLLPNGHRQIRLTKHEN